MKELNNSKVSNKKFSSKRKFGQGFNKYFQFSTEFGNEKNSKNNDLENSSNGYDVNIFNLIHAI